MRRMLLAGLLTLPAMLATESAGRAQGPGCNTPGGCGAGVIAPNFGYGYGAAGAPSNGGGHGGIFGGLGLGCPPAGPFSVGFRIFSRIHQEGPLVNYGPYEGYYPFEPYGPWTSDLRYTGSLQAPPHGHGFGGRHGFGAGGAGLATGRLRLGEISGGAGDGFGGVRSSPCGSTSSGHNWGSYSLATLKNVGHRVHGHGHHGCSTCQAAVPPAEPIQAVGLSMTER